MSGKSALQLTCRSKCWGSWLTGCIPEIRFVNDELLSFQEGRLEAKVENVVRALHIKKTQI